MAEEIRITKKGSQKADDGHRYLTVRMPMELIQGLDDLASETGRSRNELINILLTKALKIVKVEG